MKFGKNGLQIGTYSLGMVAIMLGSMMEKSEKQGSLKPISFVQGRLAYTPD